MRFVVRQPIFDYREQVEGYFLNIEKPTGGLVDTVSEVAAITVALDRIPRHSWAMVECGVQVLASMAVRRLPMGRVVLAISSDEYASAEMLRCVRELRREGFTFAIADFEANREWEPYLPFMDWVAVRGSSLLCKMKKNLAAGKARNARMIARNLDTRSDLAAADNCGFRYFEGAYYLSSAQELAREVPPAKLACLRLLTELQRPVLHYAVIENLIKAEPSFCYRFMRYMNSSAFFGVQKVTGIRHAMSLLGDDELRRWLSLMATVAAVDGRPTEVVVCAMLRARLCELLSPDAPDAGFMTGLFSLMPLVVNMQLSALLSVVRLPQAVERALWGEPGALRALLDLAVAFERARWNMVHDLAHGLGITDERVFAARGDASRWTNGILATQAAPANAMTA
ncbi:putative signal transduction protein [Candidatus Koribacter versatilis Ellin345]|uniref:Signal transduction protein n=1 Tax=Koribacter versatilis (strain Ellin345) TaxID=204669 RepID=Q1IML7_KORVE|nr:HDOD domain-containing protein [Candidatus Koribacter versatilis]ABF41883.1 putative signal transduction protein [Candidatus Koribacter versatilis Ellin345]